MQEYVTSLVTLIVFGYTAVRWGVYYALGLDTLPRTMRHHTTFKLSMIGLMVGLGLGLGYTLVWMEKYGGF